MTIDVLTQFAQRRFNVLAGFIGSVDGLAQFDHSQVVSPHGGYEEQSANDGYYDQIPWFDQAQFGPIMV